MIEIGSKAPDFTLRDQGRRNVQLSQHKGKRVLLSFRPLAWTPVCHDQMFSLESHHQQLLGLNTVPLGSGVDSAPSNKAWADAIGIKNLRLLADFWPHGEIARQYGVFREADGFSERANIIIDEAQRVIFAKIYPTNQLPDIEEVIAFIEKLS